MLLVFLATSAIRPTSHLVPQPYDYNPSQGYHHYHNAPRFAVPSYSVPEVDFFHQPSAEELDEHEYRRALEVVVNHRRRQAEREAAFRRQQLAETARRRYFTTLAAGLKQRQQEELLAAHRAESIRSQQARARLVVAERQHALNAVLRQLEGAQLVRHIRTFVVYSTLISSSPQIIRQLHVAKIKPLVNALKQRLTTESETDTTEPIQNIISSLEPRPVQSDGPKDSGEDTVKLIENLLSSIFPGLVFHAELQPTLSTKGVQPGFLDKEKGKARAVDIEEPQKPATKSESAGEGFSEILRRVMELSKSTIAPRSPDEAGPSGSSPSPSSTRPAVAEKEQGQIDRAIALSSVKHVQDTLTKLQPDFVLPTELDHYAPSSDDRDEATSVSSISSSDLMRLIHEVCWRSWTGLIVMVMPRCGRRGKRSSKPSRRLLNVSLVRRLRRGPHSSPSLPQPPKNIPRVSMLTKTSPRGLLPLKSGLTPQSSSSTSRLPSNPLHPMQNRLSPPLLTTRSPSPTLPSSLTQLLILPPNQPPPNLSLKPQQ